MWFRKKSKAAAPPLVPIAITGEPDLRGLGRLLWAKKAKILGITLLAAAAAFAVVNTITPRYRSESRLLLEARENVFLRAEADKNGGDRTTIDPEAVTSQIQLVLSRDLAREVIKKEKLASLPEFDPSVGSMPAWKIILGLIGIGRDPSTMSPEERTLESFYNRLNVYAVEKSRVIGVDFDSADPELASPRCQYHRRDLPHDAADGEAGADPGGRRLVGRRDRRPAHQGGGGGSQGRRLSHQVQSVCRRQQLPRCRPSNSPISMRKSPRRVGRKPTWRRGRSNCASSSAPANRSNPPTSPIPIPCAA